MTTLTPTTIAFAVMFHLATAILVIGITRKIIQYARTPAPLKIPTTPAPITKAGVVARLFREIVFFESLFKACKWTWLFGWLFHFGLLIVLIRHLRYFSEPVWWLVAVANELGAYMGWVMVIGLLGLLARRFLVDRIRYISAPSDFLMLFLIIAIGVSGILIKNIFHSDTVQLKAFMLGLIKLNWQPLPHDPVLLIHLSLVIMLMLIFPISKLLHAPGIVFSPTLNQVDNPRERRHVTPWNDTSAD